MVRIAGKQLDASNVHWELDLPRDMSGDWTLFETSRAELLHFEKCSFTVRNPSVGRTAFHPGVAIFDIKAPPGTPGMAMDPTSTDEHVVTIDLQNCVARGEAALVRDNELQPLRLHWDNGLLATSERLLVAAGGSTQPRQLGYIQIRLRHVTAIVQGGLALLTNSEDSPYQLLTDINATDSILSSTAAAPLLEQRGPNDPQDYLARVQWSGERNCFDGVEVFWKIINSATQSSLRQLDFEGWRQLWMSRSKQASNLPIAWQRLPDSDRPFHRHVPADYALDDAVADNPAVGGASDGSDDGCIISQLPTMPPDEAVDSDRKSTGAASDASERK